ncbi:MAG: HTH domain-containing protein, partial [Bacteroidales bacterium]
VRSGIFATTEYLELFFRNLLMNESNELKNRDLRVYVGELSVNKSKNVGEKRVKRQIIVGEMSEKKQLILKLIENNNKISAKELAAELDVTSRTIERELQKLKEEGIIVRQGGARGGYWKIIN